eukprot:5705803-Prymnesium_polylepis.2
MVARRGRRAGRGGQIAPCGGRTSGQHSERGAVASQPPIADLGPAPLGAWRIFSPVSEYPPMSALALRMSCMARQSLGTKASRRLDRSKMTSWLRMLHAPMTTPACSLSKAPRHHTLCRSCARDEPTPGGRHAASAGRLARGV